MGLLSTTAIIDRLFDKNPSRRLVISPLLNMEQISHSTIDIRIGNEFIIPKRSDASLFDPLEPERMKSNLLKAEREYVAIGERFFLHPNKVILGGTVEYFSIPPDLAGRVRTRSSYERLGLSISTLANPGYRGALTLTLVN